MNLLKVLNNPITTNYWLAALIGVLITFPSIMPSVNALYRTEGTNKECEFRKYIALEGKLWKMPLLYAITNALAFYLVNRFVPHYLKRYWFMGMFMGMFYPTLGTIGDYAKKAYGVTSYYQLYFSAQLLYIFFYGIIISSIVHLIK